MENQSINETEANQIQIKTKMQNLFEEIINNIFFTKQTFIENEVDKYLLDYEHDSIENLDAFNKEKNYFNKINIGNGYDIIAVKNCPQLKGFLCGFHSLFNTINFLKFYYYKEKALLENNRNSKNIHNALYYLNKMNNRSKFWKFHLKTKIFFANEFPSEVKNLQNLSSLERYQLRHYINNNKHFQKLINDENVDIEINYFFLSFGIINSLTKPEIVELQNKLEDFKNRNQKKTKLFIIILGIVNHWSVMIIEKKKENYRIFYLDSYEENLHILANMDNMQELADKLLKETEKYKKPVSEWGRKCFYQFLKDLHLSFQIICDLINKNFSLINFYIENILINFTNSFFSIVDEETEKNIMTNDDNVIKNNEKFFNMFFEIFSKILSWIKMDYHPRIIYLDIVSTMQIFGLSKENNKIESFLKAKMINFIALIDSLESKFDRFNLLYPEIFISDDKELIERLISVNQQMKEFF